MIAGQEHLCEPERIISTNEPTELATFPQDFKLGVDHLAMS